MKRMLCLWLPNWPIQRLVAVRPELKEQALLLYTRKGSRGQRIVACSNEAAALGVAPDMPLAEATSLIRKSRKVRKAPGSRPQAPKSKDFRNKDSASKDSASKDSASKDSASKDSWSLGPGAWGLATKSTRSALATRAGVVFHSELYDPVADRRKLEQFAERCEKFSPIVGIEPVGRLTSGEAAEPESLLMDVTGLAPLFGGEEALLRKMVAEFAEQGYCTRAAIADSIGAAWGVARFAAATNGAATNAEAPNAEAPNAEARNSDGSDSVVIVPAGQSAAALAPLPLSALRLPDTTIAILHQLGIQRVEQLLRLPRASLAARFGDLLILRIDQALGRVREIITAHRAPAVFQAEWLLEYPTAQRELVERITHQLIERVSYQLNEHKRGAIRLEICLRCLADEEMVDSTLRPPVPVAAADESAKNLILPARRYPPLLFRVGLFRPTAVTRHLWNLAQLQFEQTQWPGPVERITVQATLTAPLEIRQGELFDGSVRSNQQQLAHLIERLSNRLGMECVLQPRVVADAQPDRACRYVPLAGRLNFRAGNDVSDEKRQSYFQALDRPLFLQNPPLPLQVLTAVNQNPPARFRDQRHWHAVIRFWGPERIETGWWRGTSVRRDYYRVETEAGLWFWIFRQLNDGQWFLHGRYE